jgi:hypothetical protein
MMFAPCRGSGTMRLGAGAAPAPALAAGAAATTGAFPCEPPSGGREATTGADGVGGFGTTTAAGRCGAFRASASACLRSRIAFSASPGFDIPDKLNDGRESVCCCGLFDPPPRRFLKYPRTFSASSASMELLCVFVSVTPTAVRASRMDLLLTSSSRARSLIRTLLIRPFCVPLRR